MVLRWQTLLLMPVVTVLAGSSWAAFETLGVFIAICALAWAAYIRFTICWRSPARYVALGLLWFFTLSVVLPLISSARGTARCVACMLNLKQIAEAVLNYEAEHGCLPPAYMTDKDGKPMHSWRILVLPYLDRKDLYIRYNFNEPWDGPNNRKLLAERPSVFRCPGDDSAGESGSATTSYLAVVGSRTAWQADKSVSLKDLQLRGRVEDTVLLIEAVDSGTLWTEPKDFSLEDLEAASDRRSNPIIHSPHAHDNGYFFCKTPGVWAVFADSAIHFLPARSLTADELTRLLAVGGCEMAYWQLGVSSPGNEELHLYWPHVIGLAVWIISVAWLLCWAVRRRKAAARRAVIANGALAQ